MSVMNIKKINLTNLHQTISFEQSILLSLSPNRLVSLNNKDVFLHTFIFKQIYGHMVGIQL